jgi:CHAD domain-containing protein
LSAALAIAREPSPDHEALRALLIEQLEALVRHGPVAASGADAGALRRFRVATRRLRALLRAARPLLVTGWSEPLRAELGWLGAAAGPARDLDVLLAHVREAAAGFDPGERFVLARALRQLEDRRDAARRAVLDALTSERYAALARRLEHELPEPRVRPSPLTLHDLAAAETRRLRKAYRVLGGMATDDELHDLRLRVKRARYVAELAERTGAKAAGRYVSRAKAVQDILGEHQDATVAEAHIRALLQRPQSVRWAVAAGRLIERQAVRREAARRVFPAAWDELEKAARPLR